MEGSWKTGKETPVGKAHQHGGLKQDAVVETGGGGGSTWRLEGVRWRRVATLKTNGRQSTLPQLAWRLDTPSTACDKLPTAPEQAPAPEELQHQTRRFLGTSDPRDAALAVSSTLAADPTRSPAQTFPSCVNASCDTTYQFCFHQKYCTTVWATMR